MLTGGAMLFAFFGPTELMIIAVLAVLLFGKNLPQVARQAGHAMSELKKSMAGLQSELNSAIYSSDPTPGSRQSSYSSYRDDDDRDEPTAPKFEPPPAELPVAESQVEMTANSATAPSQDVSQRA